MTKSSSSLPSLSTTSSPPLHARASGHLQHIDAMPWVFNTISTATTSSECPEPNVNALWDLEPNPMPLHYQREPPPNLDASKTMQTLQTQHGHLKPNTGTSNPTWMPQTQHGHLKPNADASNPMRILRTQCGYLKPNMNASNPTPTCQVKHPTSYVDCGRGELNMDILNPTRMCRTWPGGGGPYAGAMRLMGHGEGWAIFVHDVCCIANMYFICTIAIPETCMSLI